MGQVIRAEQRFNDARILSSAKKCSASMQERDNKLYASSGTTFVYGGKLTVSVLYESVVASKDMHLTVFQNPCYSDDLDGAWQIGINYHENYATAFVSFFDLNGLLINTDALHESALLRIPCDQVKKISTIMVWGHIK